MNTRIIKDSSGEMQEELVALENELHQIFGHFKQTYAETVDPGKNLSSQEVYAVITGEYRQYSDEIEHIKKRAVELLKRAQGEHDSESYQDLIDKLKNQTQKAK